LRKNLLHYWFLMIVFTAAAYGQSTDQLFPTPVRTTEITSSIKARAIGDPRLTTYYYTFEGRQGDVFINVQSTNFTGDIDVYVLPGQVPMTKIVVYGDQPETETGRVVYLRKPERLLLRIQGRSPGDEDASVRIKFAGSFAVSQLDDSGAPDVPKVESTAETNVRVNSVGTILEVIPKATPTPAAVAERSEVVADEPKSDAKIEEEKEAAKKEDAAATEPVTVSRKVEVLVTDPVKPEESVKDPAPRRATARNRRTRPAPTPKIEEKAVEEPAAEKAADPPPRTTTRSSRRRRAATRPDEETQPDPMANIRLVVYFKDGSTIDRPMNEVLRFSVERAVLTVISKNGTIGRYNMTEVARVSIE